MPNTQLLLQALSFEHIWSVRYRTKATAVVSLTLA